MKRFLFLLLFTASLGLTFFSLVSLSAYSGANDYELSINWKLKYGILKEDGTIRGDRPEGYVSDIIDRVDETQLYLKNFQCSKAIQQLVCPVIFYDKQNRIIGYIQFKKEDGPSDYTVDIPKNCVRYQLSTEYINSLHPQVFCNRDQKSSLTRMRSKRSQYDRVFSSGVKTLQNELKNRKVLYSMPVDTKTDITIVLKNGESIAHLIQQCESQYRNKSIAIKVDGDYQVEKTERLTTNDKHNKYVICCDGLISGLHTVKDYRVKGNTLSFSRPAGINSIESILVNDQEYVISGDFSQNNPDLMPSFKDVKISLVNSAPGKYIYRIPLKDVSHFVRGSYVKIFSEWVCQMAEVVAVGKNSIDVMSHTEFGQTLMSSTYPVNLYCVRNNKKFSSPGTFWYDANTVYCNLKQLTGKVESVAIPVNSKLFEISNSSNIIFKGVHFGFTSASDIYTYYKQGAMDCDGAISVSSSTDIHFLDCEFDHIGNNCISIRYNSNRCSLQGNYFHDLGTGAIVVNNSKMPWEKGYVADNTNSIFIYSNIVRGYGNLNSGATGILVGYGNNVSIISNHVFDGFYTGISVGWGWNQYHLNKNTYVAGNVVHHVMKFLMCDGGGIYTLSNWDGGSIEGNVIYCVNTRSRKDCAFGIYHDTGSSEILDYNNLIYACDLGNGSCESGGVIENNIYSYIGDYVFQVREGKETMTSFVTRNLVNNLGKNLFSTSFGTLSEEPMTRISNNVMFGIPAIPETFNAYAWSSLEPEFDNPGIGSFVLKNSASMKTKLGFNTDRQLDYSGHQIPPFKSIYADKITLDTDYISHYNYLYNTLSVNKNNPFFTK